MRAFPLKSKVRAQSGPTDERPLRVLFLHSATRPPLGADTWVHAQIIGALDRTRHEIHVACATGTVDAPTPTYEVMRKVPETNIRPVDLGRELVPSGVVGKARDLVATVPALFELLRLAKYVRRNRIDVIHTSDRPRDSFAAVILGRLTGATSIVHCHTAWGPWMQGMLRWALRHADVLITVSAFVASSLTETGHDPARIHVVLNGIDPDDWRPGAGRDGARRELGVDQGARLIVTVCRLFPEKGPADLIRAVAILRERHPEARLLVVGQEMIPGYAAELASLAATLDLGDRVQFLGRRPDIPRLLAAADVYAMPSTGEPFGIVYLEAMAMALPVVALESGGAPELIVDGKTGLLSRPGSIADIAANLAVPVEDPERASEMGRLGRERVESLFTVTRMAAAVADVYEMTISSDRGRTTRRKEAA
jgi:glycosyltransferase involved in cell wall biosynthesis